NPFERGRPCHLSCCARLTDRVGAAPCGGQDQNLIEAGVSGREDPFGEGDLLWWPGHTTLLDAVWGRSRALPHLSTNPPTTWCRPIRAARALPAPPAPPARALAPPPLGERLVARPGGAPSRLPLPPRPPRSAPPGQPRRTARPILAGAPPGPRTRP